MKIAVVILNWNGKIFLERFLPGVIKHSSDVAEVIIADNDSTDGSVEFLNTKFPDIRVIRNESNGGFAKGYNDAFQQVEADYYILLNSDIEVTENWIMPVIELMETDRLIAACQPKMLSYHERNKFEYAGAAGGFIDKYGYPFCRGRIFSDLEEDNGQYNDVTEIFWATGACMFVKADLYHKFNGLDNDFFAHMEEIDFCWRLKNAGYRIMYCPDAKVYHIGGGTLPKDSARKTYLNFRNNCSLLYKNLPPGQVFRVFAVRMVLDGIAGLKFLFDSGYKNLWAVIRGHLSFYRNFRKLRHKRKSIQPVEVSRIFKGNLVYEHYVKGIKKFSDLDQDNFS